MFFFFSSFVFLIYYFHAGKTVLFSFEEAIGFCVGSTVVDKVFSLSLSLSISLSLCLSPFISLICTALPHVYVKDGISAACCVAELAFFLAHQVYLISMFVSFAVSDYFFLLLLPSDLLDDSITIRNLS